MSPALTPPGQPMPNDCRDPSGFLSPSEGTQIIFDEPHLCNDLQPITKFNEKKSPREIRFGLTNHTHVWYRESR